MTIIFVHLLRCLKVLTGLLNLVGTLLERVNKMRNYDEFVKGNVALSFDSEEELMEFKQDMVDSGKRVFDEVLNSPEVIATCDFRLKTTDDPFVMAMVKSMGGTGIISDWESMESYLETKEYLDENGFDWSVQKFSELEQVNE